MSKGFRHSGKLCTALIERAACAASEQRLALLPEGLVVAITGQPWWSDSELERIAREQGEGDALGEAYRRHGTGLLQYLHGAFAMAVLEGRSGRVFAAVDRVGQEPLYYAAAGGGFVLGSSADCVRAHPGIDCSLSSQAIYNYVYAHMVPSPGTIYSSLHKLPGGHYVEYDGNQIHMGSYWEPPFDETNSANLDVLGEQMRTLILESVERLSKGRIAGAFLSGGLDSSTLAGMLARLQPGNANTYSIGFTATGYDEMGYARTVSRHFGTKQHEYYVTPEDVCAIVPEIARVYDEPFGNSSAVGVYYCAKLAANDGVERLLAGDGGDEIFAGNARYAKQQVFEYYGVMPLLLRRGLLEPLLFRLPETVGVVRKAQSYVRQAMTPLPDRLEAYNFLQREGAQEMFQADFLAALAPEEPLLLQRERYTRPQNASALNRMMYLDWQQTLADNDLRKVGRMCALAGVDVVYPLLDDPLLEFSCRVPSALKLKGRRLRHFYKEAMRDFLPQETIMKHKHGFGLPFGVWMAEHAPLRELAYESLLCLKKRPYFRPGFLERAIDLHRTGHAAYYGELVWILMMLELWLQAHGH
nr:asparagine synthase C-terminal domain-containing protein [Nitrosococcus halophilus]